jgi:hypothetical protein
MHTDTLCAYAFAALVAAIGLILALYGAEELRPYAGQRFQGAAIN